MIQKIKLIFKIVFYGYVFALAGFVTYSVTLGGSYGGETIDFDAPKKECFQNFSGWKYCTFRSARTNSKVILYVLHRKGQTSEFWERKIGYSALLQKYWEYHESKVPLIVTISFGKSWLVTQQNSKNTSATFARFRTEVFPTIENAVGKPKQRFILGESMGGLNAISLSLEMPKMFHRMVALCPSLYTVSPYDGMKSLVHFGFRTGATPKSIIESIVLARSHLSNEEDWVNFSPINKVKNIRFKPKQHFYLSAGLRDEYGGYEGTLEFLKGLRQTSVITHWKPNSGNHCAVDIESLGRFLKI